MTFVSQKYPAAHEHEPESIEAILQKTTRIPLYCHPKGWSDAHLDLLRVEGLDKTFSLEEVIGRPVRCDPSDTGLRELIDVLAPPLKVNEKHRYLTLSLISLFRECEERIFPGLIETRACRVCTSWLVQTRHWVREYPDLDKGKVPRHLRGTIPDTTLYLHYGEKKLPLKYHHLEYDYPDYNGYPSTFFPIVSILCRNHDDYRPDDDLCSRLESKRIIRWMRASKPAEMVALLIAMAQQQAKRLVDVSENLRGDLPPFCPLLVWVDDTLVRLVRAHVPARYLEAFADPSKPLSELLTIKMSEPFDLLDENTPAQLLPALTAFLDEYFQEFRPVELVRETVSYSDHGAQNYRGKKDPKIASAMAQDLSTTLRHTVEPQARTGRRPEKTDCLKSIGCELSVGT